MAAPDARGASEQRFESIRTELRNFLRRRYRLLANEHEDLLQQTLADLFEATQSRLAPVPDEELTALAYAILRRRRIPLAWIGAGVAAAAGIGIALRQTIIAGSAASEGRTIDQVRMFEASFFDLVSRWEQEL